MTRSHVGNSSKPVPHTASVLVDGLDHPEGVAYDPEADVIWAGGEEGQLYRVDPGGRWFEESARAGGLVLGLAVDGRRRVVACCPGDRSVSVYNGDGLKHVFSGDLRFPNFPSFGPDGALYVSDSGAWNRDDGRLWRIDPDGTLDVFSTAVPHFTNGCAVSPDGRELWVAESNVPNVSRIDLATGASEHVARVDGTVPDGVAFTSDGGLLVSCYRPDRIYHLSPSGELEVVAEDPQGTLLAAPTNVCFVGLDLDRVVAANYNRRHLTLLDLGLRGAPLHRPERWAADA
jgi:gluconolactonase